METIHSRLNQVRQQVLATEHQYARPAGSVQILAVSKNQAATTILEAVNAGQRAFGENYLQEALTKITALSAYNLEWHFTGSIQANKTKAIAENFSWIHGVDRYSIARRLSEQCPANKPELNVCIQVNIDNEPTKAGVTLTELPKLATAVAQLPRLKLRGLMTIPTPRQNFCEQRQPYQQLHQAFLQLQASGLLLDTLSMGMSDDFAAAIAEGATIVRIGTAIFGKREP